MHINRRLTELGLRLSRDESERLEHLAQEIVAHALHELRLNPHKRGGRQLAPRPKSQPKRNVVPWSKREDEILREFQGKMPLAQIQRRFFSGKDGWSKRTYAAVAQRIGVLGLSLDRGSAARLSLGSRKK